MGLGGLFLLFAWVGVKRENQSNALTSPVSQFLRVDAPRPQLGEQLFPLVTFLVGLLRWESASRFCPPSAARA